MTSTSANANASTNAGTSASRPQVIFFGNGPLADATKATLAKTCDIIFHARTKSDLEEVKRLKKSQPHAHGVLASYGVIIKSDVLDLFEPEGILNIHPSSLPKYRGPSPIETAIINGDETFGVSIMKLVAAMDAGPLYYQTTLSFSDDAPKSEIYTALAEAGATWLASKLTRLNDNVTNNSQNSTATSQPTPATLNQLVQPKPQQGEPSYTKMLSTALSKLDPATHTATELERQIRAHIGWPKSKYTFYGKECIILAAHVLDSPADAASAPLAIKCKDSTYLAIDTLQPAGKRPMDAKSFKNGYAK